MEFLSPALLMSVASALPSQLIGLAIVLIASPAWVKRNSGALSRVLGILSFLLTLFIVGAYCLWEPQILGLLILGGFVFVIIGAAVSVLLTTLFLHFLIEWRISGSSAGLKKFLAVEVGLAAFCLSPIVSQKLQRRTMENLERRLEEGHIQTSFPGHLVMPLERADRIQSVKASGSQVEVSLQSGVSKCFELHKENKWYWADCTAPLPENSEMIAPDREGGTLEKFLAPADTFQVVEAHRRNADAFLVVAEKGDPEKYRMRYYEADASGNYRLKSDSVDIDIPNSQGSYGGLSQKSAKIPDGIEKACLSVNVNSSFLIVGTCDGVYVANTPDRGRKKDSETQP